MDFLGFYSQSSDVEDEKTYRAQIRSYERRVRELEAQLSGERKVRKRKEITARELEEELEEVAEEARSKVQRLRKELGAKTEQSQQLKRVVAKLESDAVLAKKDKGRFQESLNYARDSLQEATFRAEKYKLEAQHEKGRVTNLSVKCAQMGKAQLALQMQVEDLQASHQMILEELERAQGSSLRRKFSPRKILPSLSSTRTAGAHSRISKPSRLGTFMRRKTQRSRRTSFVRRRTTGSSAGSSASSDQDRVSTRSPAVGSSSEDKQGSTVADGRAKNEVQDELARDLMKMQESSKLEKLLKGKMLYYKGLALTREDIAKQDDVLHNIVKSKEAELESLATELSAEKARNQELMVQVARERGRKNTEVKQTGGSLEKSRSELNVEEKEFNKTMFDWWEYPEGLGF